MTNPDRFTPRRRPRQRATQDPPPTAAYQERHRPVSAPRQTRGAAWQRQAWGTSIAQHPDTKCRRGLALVYENKLVLSLLLRLELVQLRAPATNKPGRRCLILGSFLLQRQQGMRQRRALVAECELSQGRGAASLLGRAATLSPAISPCTDQLYPVCACSSVSSVSEALPRKIELIVMCGRCG
jgi:hypothetical protein